MNVVVVLVFLPCLLWAPLLIAALSSNGPSRDASSSRQTFQKLVVEGKGGVGGGEVGVGGIPKVDAVRTPSKLQKERSKPRTLRSGSSKATPASLLVRRRKLEPPFPNGPCGGTVLTIPPEETFGIDVNLANINFGGDLILPPRPIKVWLPPDYQDNNNNNNSIHPTLYVHDGQNAMDDTESWTGTSWRLIGALTRMADHDLLRFDHMPIVVMIPSMDGDLLPGIRRRHLEYGDSNFPFAQAHADLVAKTVKPLVDARFRTDPSAEATFAMGSSMGGQAALHLLLRHPDKFGGVACLSPFFGPNLTNDVARSAMKGPSPLQSKRIYMDIGGDLNDVTVPWVDVLDHLTPEHWWNPGYFWLDTQLQSSVYSMKRSLEQAGVSYKLEEFPGGRHNERAWAQRVHVPLLHLMGKSIDSE